MIPLWGSGQHGEKKVQGDLISIYNYMTSEGKEDRDRLFSEVSNDKTRSKGQNLKS